ncbi:MAG: hypothetical protein RQ757_11630 [Pseudomonadales bacterium]|nr:hypothetical protein [Pseudomonadales bacterium]
MSFSTTITETKAFTLTHAKYLASKVVTDLKRIQRFYGSPSDAWISYYDQEITALLHAGYLKSVTYGFQRGDDFIEPSLIYTSQALMNSGADDDPGRILPGKDISNASFASYLTYSDEWHRLTSAQQAEFEKNLYIKRSGAPAPGYRGYLESDLNYSSGGRALARSQVRSS